MIKRLVSLVLVLASMAGVAYAADPLSRQQVEEIVREYLQKNPEVVIDAIRAAQAKQREAQREQQLQAVKQYQNDLLRDASSPVGGNVAGDVTVVEFFDYACPHCKNVSRQVKQLLREDPKVRFVYKELPVLGEPSNVAARAALAAREQGKYFAFHDALMANTGALSDAVIFRVAGEVGLDVARLKTDMETEPINAALQKNQVLARSLGITGTPAFVIGDDIAPGAVPIARLKEMVEKARQSAR
jgi:protein-disulfide isomerase